VIYVVDTGDAERLHEAKAAFGMHVWHWHCGLVVDIDCCTPMMSQNKSYTTRSSMVYRYWLWPISRICLTHKHVHTSVTNNEQSATIANTTPQQNITNIFDPSMHHSLHAFRVQPVCALTGYDAITRYW
jgi:hypothetical protein